jgi:DNA-binding transcriptional regulator of glucitol operon
VRRFLSPRWLLLHAATIILFVAFLALGWWQIDRARGGNALSFGYAIEWPAFAIFVVFVWYREIRNHRQGDGPPMPAPVAEPVLVRAGRDPVAVSGTVAPVPTDGVDPELDEYNRLLAWLAANPGRRAADFRRSLGASADS